MPTPPGQDVELLLNPPVPAARSELQSLSKGSLPVEDMKFGNNISQQPIPDLCIF